MSAPSFLHSLRTRIEDAPLEAAGIAAASGFAFARLPVFAVLLGLLRVGVILGRPALFILGVRKAWELARARSCTPGEPPAAPNT